MPVVLLECNRYTAICFLGYCEGEGRNEGIEPTKCKKKKKKKNDS